ncbi:DUF1189 family protein [Gottfriedia acidiceleris]|uniref:DUF1189 domain-containing protein n=1 Tax=Gottfriedia acidiceleris TaxID=371036 RepID=A0ABY4JI17_9BACI|nr:DUF1189 family protein [Gottfriedia acidiceleris]UPM53092.1 DUF1189 domain-containing protein [Gottfriedia acidiceleris]
MIRRFFNNRFSLKGIYGTKDNKLIFVFIQCILVGSLIAFPLVFQIVQTDSERLSERVFAPFYENKEWQNEVPNCSFNKKLTCSIEKTRIIDNKNERLVIDPNDRFVLNDKEKITIILGKTQIHVNVLGFDLYGVYNSQLVDAFNLQNYNQLFIGVVSSVKMQAVAIAMQLLYPITIITNIIFIAIVALMSLLFNIGNSIKLTYKKFFSFLAYSATVPAIFALIVGTMISMAFVYIIFNFGFILFSYYIYRKYNRVA